MEGSGPAAAPLEAWRVRGPAQLRPSRHTLKGWGLQLVSTLGVIATLVYLGTLMLSPWLGFHPQPWFLAFTVVYAIERAVTVKARGWKIQLLSVAVFPEWIYDLFLQSVQVRALWGAVWRTRSPGKHSTTGKPMYGKIAGGSGLIGTALRSPESTSCTRC